VQAFLAKISLNELLEKQQVEKLLQSLDETLATCGITNGPILSATTQCLTTLTQSLYGHSSEVYGRWKSGERFEISGWRVTNDILATAELCIPAYHSHIRATADCLRDSELVGLPKVSNLEAAFDYV
jgi:hypothetical protein